MESFLATLYTCGCGYKTLNCGNASKHKKTKCGHAMYNTSEKFVLERDVLASVSSNTTNCITGDGDHFINNGSLHMSNITINLSVPEKSVVSAVYDAVKNPQCAKEIKYADPQEIPAILFKYTRGTCADKQYIKYDPDKNEVLHKDPITGKEISKELKKYRNDYLGKNAAVYDHTYHIQYMPAEIQRSMNELSRPMFDSGKKKDTPIPGADVIKMCASGDHRMYKLPHDSKQFFSDVVDNVDREIKLT